MAADCDNTMSNRQRTARRVSIEGSRGGLPLVSIFSNFSTTSILLSTFWSSQLFRKVMSAITAQRLVSAQRASPFPVRRLHSLTDSSAPNAPLSRRHVSSHKPNPPQENPSVNLWSQIREARPAARYTLYAGLGLMATAETVFWFKVVRAKYFPSKVAEEREEAARLLEDFTTAIEGYRAVWLRNYGRYYGTYVWGAG